MPEATAAIIDKNGFLHSGDLGIKTPEGNYKITGRIKDMIIRGGENIYPREIEEFLYQIPQIKDVQVAAVLSKKYGEEVGAFIILKEGESLHDCDVKDAIIEIKLCKLIIVYMSLTFLIVKLISSKTQYSFVC